MGRWKVKNCRGLKVYKAFASSDALKVCAALLSLALLLSAGACGRGEREAQAEEITVAAAANLTDAFGEIAKRFTARTGVRVTNSFGATADLSKQIENGAPFDVFASADVEHVEG